MRTHPPAPVLSEVRARPRTRRRGTSRLSGALLHFPGRLLLAAALLGPAAALLVLAVGPAAAEPASGGLFVPGRSLGAVELGMTRAQVRETWGPRHGVCDDCPRPTWYFNERPFRPQGTGVVFEDGRVSHAFTVWKPSGWSTPEGLELGEQGGEIGAAYGELTRRQCVGYSALVREGPRASSVFYVYEDEVWGFGLVTPGRSPCL